MKNVTKACRLIAGIAVTGLLVAAPLALAGHGHRGGRNLARLAEKLDLSDTQRTQMRSIVQAERQKNEPARDAARAKREELVALFEAPTPDFNAIGKKAYEMHQLKVASKGKRDGVRNQLRAVLTPEQQKQFDEMKARRP